MNDTVIISLVALVGSLAGTFGGILTSTRLTTYRIEQLEKKAQEQKSLIERTFKLEKERDVMNERLRAMETRLSQLGEEKAKSASCTCKKEEKE